MTSRTARFTLIELLVVVAIIMILAAIVLPALNRAKARAQILTCLNHQRQLGVNCHLYADEYTDFPVCQPQGNANHYATGLDSMWIQRLLAGKYIKDVREAMCRQVRTTQYRSNGTSYYDGWRLHYSSYEFGYKVAGVVNFNYRWFGPMQEVAQNGLSGYDNIHLQDWRVFDSHSNSPTLIAIRNQSSDRHVSANAYYRTHSYSNSSLLLTCVDPKRIRDAEEGFFGHQETMIRTATDVWTGHDMRCYLMSDGSGGTIFK